MRMKRERERDLLMEKGQVEGEMKRWMKREVEKSSPSTCLTLR